MNVQTQPNALGWLVAPAALLFIVVFVLRLKSDKAFQVTSLPPSSNRELSQRTAKI